MLIFLVGQPHSLGPLTGTNKDQAFVSVFISVPWHTRSFAVGRNRPATNSCWPCECPWCWGFGWRRGVLRVRVLGGALLMAKANLDFICLYNVVHLEEKKKKLDGEDPLLAQMSVPQLIYPDNFALLSGWRMEWLPQINVVTSVWVTHRRDGEMQLIHLCLLWKPFPIIGD